MSLKLFVIEEMFFLMKQKVFPFKLFLLVVSVCAKEMHLQSAEVLSF